MQLRNSRDRRTLVWTAAMPVVTAVQYIWPSLLGYVTPVACYFALCAGVIAHNHNHCPTFTDRRSNRAFGLWLSLFYGYPTFAWIPTHNQNHHRFLNGEGDATVTWRYGNRHNLPTAVSYFFVSSYWQSGPIKDYIRKARESSPTTHRRILTEYFFWGGAAVVLLALAISLHGPALGFKVWLIGSVVPAFFALWTIMLFNYEQHVHAAPYSEHSHSRSWEGRTVNYLLFNNGYHAAHHEHPGAHWSELPQLHAALAPSIDPALIEGSLSWYFVKNYLLATFSPRFGTKQLGAEPSTLVRPTASSARVASAE
jgi:fatty acid desaturase